MIWGFTSRNSRLVTRRYLFSTHLTWMRPTINDDFLIFLLKARRTNIEYVHVPYGKFWINTLLSTLVQPLHYILKCNYFGMTTEGGGGVGWELVKIISIPDEKLFSERAPGAPLHTLSKLYDFPVGFVPPSFEAVYCYICGRRRVGVARYLCLVLVNSNLFPLPCGAGIIARLSDVGLPSLFLWHLQYFIIFASRMHIFKHSYLCTFVSRGTFQLILHSC